MNIGMPQKMGGKAQDVILPLLLLGGASIFDFLTSIGVAAGVLYVLAIIATLQLNASRTTWMFAVVTTVLIVMGWSLSSGGALTGSILANRIISILAVWVTTFIVTNGIRTSLSLQSLHETHESEANRYAQTLEDQQQKLLKMLGDRTQDQSIIEERTVALERQEKQFRQVVEAAPSGIVMVNQVGIIVLSNEKIAQQFGYSSELLVGQKVEVLLPTRFRAQHAEHCANFFENLGWREMGRGREVFGLRQDGTEFQVEVALNPIATEEGTFVLASVVDITERKETERKVRALHQRNELLLTSAAQGIYGLDVEGKTTFVNPAAATMLGYSVEELIGCPMHAMMHYMKPDGSLYPREECPMYVAFMDGTTHHVEDEILWRKDGTSFPVAYTSTPMRDENENIIGAVVTFSDISARKATEQALLKWNQALETSNQELDDFAYIASHDLKEPLRGIHNYSKILLEDHGEALNDEAQARCETILRLSRHMETLLDALLYFSRVGRSELAVGPTDLDVVLGNVLESIDVSLKERGILIQVPQIFPTVACDGTRVGEIFRNLITNAMKYNDKPEKWIEIGYLEGQIDGGDASSPLVFFVRDNGIGIREKHLSSIFRIFKRLHGRDKFDGGTGAGLTMAKKMIERHGGRIWVESTYGEGSIFYFTLGQSKVTEGMVGESMAISQAGRM